MTTDEIRSMLSEIHSNLVDQITTEGVLSRSCERTEAAKHLHAMHELQEAARSLRRVSHRLDVVDSWHNSIKEGY